MALRVVHAAWRTEAWCHGAWRMVHVRACCRRVRVGRRLEALGVERREVRRPRLQRGGGRDQRAHGDERRLDGDRGRRELVAHLRRQAGVVEGGRRGAAVMVRAVMVRTVVVRTLERQRLGMRARGWTPAGIRRRGGVGKGRPIRVPVSLSVVGGGAPQQTPWEWSGSARGHHRAARCGTG